MNVLIVRSRVNGSIENGDGSQPGHNFAVADSEIIADAGATGISESYFSADRVDISGGNRAVNCYNQCTVKDSWTHGTRLFPASQHASGMRMGMNTTYTHNSIVCDVAPTPEEGGCSADLTGYPDFSPVHHNTITNNFFMSAMDAAFCAYGGGTGGKAYSNDLANATYIVFKDNVFGRGANRQCAAYGPITDFILNRTGNEWVNNLYDDGSVVSPA